MLAVLHGKLAVGEVVVVVSHETVAKSGPGEEIDGDGMAAGFSGHGLMDQYCAYSDTWK